MAQDHVAIAYARIHQRRAIGIIAVDSGFGKPHLGVRAGQLDDVAMMIIEPYGISYLPDTSPITERFRRGPAGRQTGLPSSTSATGASDCSPGAKPPAAT